MLKTGMPAEIFQRRKEFGFQNSFNMLTEIIEADKDDKKRRESVKFLGLISDHSNQLKKSCFETLENLLVSDDKIEIKCEAAKALGRIKYEKSLKPLNWVLEQKPVNNDIKLSVLKAIHKTRFEEPEIKLFINELDNEFRSIKDFVSIQLLSLEPEKLVNLFLITLKDKKFSNRHHTEVLRLLGYEISSINVSFEDTSYIKIKYPGILVSLNQYKNTLLDVITQNLRVDDSNLMDSILTILKILKSEIVEDLIKYLLIDDFIVKKNAVILCGRLKLKETADLLITNLDNIYNEVSIAAIEALGEIGDLSTVPELLNILDIEDISFEYTDLDMKLYILDAIKKIFVNNPSPSYDFLYSALETDNITVRESIAFILGEIGKDEFLDPLVGLLKATMNLDVRKNTIIALGKIGNVKSLEDLVQIIEDKNSYWLIKKVAIDAIYNTVQKNWYRVREGEKDIIILLNKNIARLIDHLGTYQDENFRVKLGLIKLLENYGGKQALSSLLKRVNDFHRVVRIYASNAIKKIEEMLELENS